MAGQPVPWQLGFQDPASPIAEGIIRFHHDLRVVRVFVVVFVAWRLGRLLHHFVADKNPTAGAVVPAGAQTAQDRQAASLMGIDTQRMFALGWAIGSACVGVAGGLLAMFFYIFPEVGAPFALLAYVTVALGGFGNVPATLAGGVLVGLVEALSGLVLTPALKYSAVFTIYLAVVLWRPQGLFGRF